MTTSKELRDAYQKFCEQMPLDGPISPYKPFSEGWKAAERALDGGWNFDMSAAPRDGKNICFLFKGGNISAGYWLVLKNGAAGWTLCGSGQNNMLPIAWQPLPSAPEQGGGG